MKRRSYLPGDTSLPLALIPPAKIMDAPDWAKVTSVIAGIASLVWGNLFWSFLVVGLAPATIADFYFGSHAAHVRSEYDANRASRGWNAKLAGVIELILVYTLEWWATQHGLAHLFGVTVQTNGAIATILAVGLFGKELDSIEHHRTQMGAGPIPGLSQVTALLRRVWVGRIPDSKPVTREGQP